MPRKFENRRGVFTCLKAVQGELSMVGCGLRLLTYQLTALLVGAALGASCSTDAVFVNSRADTPVGDFPSIIDQEEADEPSVSFEASEASGYNPLSDSQNAGSDSEQLPIMRRVETEETGATIQGPIQGTKGTSQFGKKGGAVGGKGQMIPGQSQPGQFGKGGKGGTVVQQSGASVSPYNLSSATTLTSSQRSLMDQGAYGSVVIQARGRGTEKKDILWVVENGTSMEVLQYREHVSKNVLSFLSKYSSSTHKLGLISAQGSTQVAPCVSAIYKPKLDISWGLEVPQSWSHITRVNCAVETLSPLATLNAFLQPSSSVAGVSGDMFFRKDAQPVIIVVSDGFSMSSDGVALRDLLLARFPEGSVSFYSFSTDSSQLTQDDQIQLSLGDFHAPYEAHVESATGSKCGHYYTSTYEHLALQFSGRTFPICEKDWQGYFDIIMSDLMQKSYQQISLYDLSAISFSLHHVKVDGQMLPASHYSLVSADVPMLRLHESGIVTPDSTVELGIENRH